MQCGSTVHIPIANVTPEHYLGLTSTIPSHDSTAIEGAAGLFYARKTSRNSGGVNVANVFWFILFGNLKLIYIVSKLLCNNNRDYLLLCTA